MVTEPARHFCKERVTGTWYRIWRLNYTRGLSIEKDRLAMGDSFPEVWLVSFLYGSEQIQRPCEARQPALVRPHAGQVLVCRAGDAGRSGSLSSLSLVLV
jgi:hypothetical protein